MGEYARRKSDGVEIKMGTCEEMYYLRIEDKKKVTPLKGSGFGHFWRIPFPDEDGVFPGEYKEFRRGYRLAKQRADGCWEDFTNPGCVSEPGIIQLHHECGLLLNATCYHGEKLPELTKPMQAFWNGKSWSYELAHLRTTDDGKVHPVVHCRHCLESWRFTWDEILPWIHDAELKSRLEKYVFDATVVVA